MYKKCIKILLIFVATFTIVQTKAQNPQTLTFEQAARYYKFWEGKLWGLQHPLSTTYWKKEEIDRVNKLPALAARMEKDIKEHPNYFKLYPKQLKTYFQAQSVCNKNYKQFTAFNMAGDSEDPPADGGIYLSFYKRYAYWRKLMDDKAESVLKTGAEFMLEAEKSKLEKRKEKLEFALKYCKALKVLYPNNPKADMLVARTTKNLKGASGTLEGANYYAQKAKIIHWKFTNLSQNEWSENELDEVKRFNFPEFYKKMEADKAKSPDYFKIYPSTLPGSGMGCMTKKNVDQFTAFGVAPADKKPPLSVDAKTITDFYEDYAYWKLVMKNNGESLVRNLRNAITKAEQKHIDYKYEAAIFVLDYAKTLQQVCPDNERIEELVNDANDVLKSTIEELRSLFCGKFHEKNLQKIFVFKNKPVCGKENEANIVNELKVGEAAWITGYFTSKNSLGLPTLAFMKIKEGEPNYWKSDKQAQIPMFNQLELKAEYKPKAYFTFNLFPDIEKTNYKSHVQYFPHLNFLKWLTFQPSEVLNLKVKWGKTKKMAEGTIKIDLSGNNKQKVKDYLKKMEAKRLSMVTYPNMCGTSNATASISNFSDLSKYGKVLRITLKKTGNIMKPWPHDDQVDWNTAAGFMAVEKNGKVTILALDFRKKPTASKWQWWSLGSFPELYPATDYGYSNFNAVKKISGGYQILKQNVNKTSTWYEK